jgi:hypothetical protein
VRSDSLVVAGTATSSALGMSLLVRPRDPGKPPSHLLTSPITLYQYFSCTLATSRKTFLHLKNEKAASARPLSTMSEPEVDAVALPPSGGSETSSKSLTGSVAQEPELMTLAQVHSVETPNGIKRYTPPKADARTFPSQQAFLESLTPMLIDHVEEDKRKCPICWKPFGEEADPGFDNSESPVKLRCGHIFGHKCLTTIFGVQDPSRVFLQPLSCEDGSKGLLLGTRLHVYAAKHGPNFRNAFETFQSMLLKTERLDGELSGEELFGEYWWRVLREVSKERDNPSLSDITFMENAVILDHQSPKPEHSLDPYAIDSQFLSLSSTGLEQTLVQSSLNSDATPIWSSQQSDPTAIPSFLESASMGIPLSTHLNTTASTQLVAMTDSTQSSIDLPGNDISGTWEMNLASETNLDKLSAIQKHKSDQAKPAESSFGKTSEYVQKYQRQLMHHRARGRHYTQSPSDHQCPCSVQVGANIASAHERHRDILAERLTGAYSQFLKAQKQVTNSTYEAQPRIIWSSKTLHSFDLQNSSYEICSPSLGPMFGDEDDGDEHEDTFDSRGATFVIERTICSACGGSLEDHALPAGLATPTEIWWHSHKNAPDDCPMCHRVLFLKGTQR